MDNSSEAVPDVPPESSTKKRKRLSRTEELEVDINAPEPPSKKALRKAKKTKTEAKPSKKPVAVIESQSSDLDSSSEQEKPVQRSQYGVWIGNLPFTVTENALRKFLQDKGPLTDAQITRVNLPAPNASASTPGPKRIKPQNKGFAYVDLSTPEALKRAIALSETLFTGRRVLIKDAKSFAGRPDKKDDSLNGTGPRVSKPPNRRIFVGNLAFDVTNEAIEKHYAPCGAVSNVHLATFEDSGKCKGYGWIEFEDLEAAEAAVRGWVKISEEQNRKAADESSGDDDDTKENSKKQRKWWVNKMKGRPLRTEFAEDKAVRYKKRFGKNSIQKSDLGEPIEIETPSTPEQASEPPGRDTSSIRKGDRRNRKVDARTIKPGAALASAPRLTGGIVASTGKKINFD